MYRGVACVAVAAAVWLVAPAPDSLRAALGLFVLTGALWVTQALPLTITALAVPLLAVLLGLMSPREALAPFAHPVIFLFLGGLALAAALARQGLAGALAEVALRAVGGRRAIAVVLLSGLTAVLSMWMSNTATAAMMLPLALGLLRNADPAAAPDARDQAFVLLALAYSASVGGIGTLVGSPPNAIAAAQAGINFTEWLRIGLPMVALLWPLMLGVLWLVLRPSLGGRADIVHVPMSWTHLAMEYFQQATGTRMTHVPYKGVGAALSDLLGGQLQVYLTPGAAVLSHVAAGRLRALAQTSERRLPTMPELPAVAEVATGFITTFPYAMVAPAGTPGTVVARLNASIGRIVQQPEVLERLRSYALEPAHSTPQALMRDVAAEVAIWHKVVKAGGITID